MVFNKKEYMKKWWKAHPDYKEKWRLHTERGKLEVAKGRIASKNRMRKILSDSILREKFYNYKSRLYQNNREKVLIEMGGKCVWCGVTELLVLTFDHINGNGRKDADRYHGYHRIALKRRKEFQLLCANCQLFKAKIFGEFRKGNK